MATITESEKEVKQLAQSSTAPVQATKGVPTRAMDRGDIYTVHMWKRSAIAPLNSGNKAPLRPLNHEPR